MIVIKTSDIPEKVSFLLKTLKEQGLAEKTVSNYSRTYTLFCIYLSDNDIENVTETVCLDYLEPMIGKRLSGLHEKPGEVKNRWQISPLYLMMYYESEGTLCHTSHRCTPAFKCPIGFVDGYEGYMVLLNEKGIKSTHHHLGAVRRFIDHLSSAGITSFEQITYEHIEKYLLQYKNNSIKTRGYMVNYLKKLFGYLYGSGITDDDLREYLPKLRIPRSSGIPHTWTKEELTALLNAIDREDPAGKRNYAVFLLTIHTGLRAGDIRNLRLSNIDWESKTIHLIMGKTTQPIDLPMSDAVGWSIIDYLKNGRPNTKSDHVFVRHRAPFTSIRGTAALDSAINRYLFKAGIAKKPGEHYGMHSLRSTLARNMLTSGAALATISQTLGHEDPKSTEIYLKTSIDDLRLCAIDPDEEDGT